MKHIERWARHVAVLLVAGALVVLVGTAAAGFAPAVRSRLGWTATDRQDYAVGDLIDIPARLRDRSERTLVVFASGTCGASIRSKPAIAQLSADLRVSTTARFLLVTPVNMKADQELLVTDLGLSESEYASLDMSLLKVRSVPTVVLVDKSGRILFSRVGLIDDATHDAIWRAVRGGQS